MSRHKPRTVHYIDDGHQGLQLHTSFEWCISTECPGVAIIEGHPISKNPFYEGNQKSWIQALPMKVGVELKVNAIMEDS